MLVRNVIAEALEHIHSYDQAASTMGKAIAVQNTHMCLTTAQRYLSPVAWRASFYPGNWKLYEYDPVGIPGIIEIRPLYE